MAPFSGKNVQLCTKRESVNHTVDNRLLAGSGDRGLEHSLSGLDLTLRIGYLVENTKKPRSSGDMNCSSLATADTYT